MRYRQDHKRQTRERVLREAAAAIRADGPAGISVGSVMKRAGLTHGGFYAHFASRDALLAEAVDGMFADAAPAILSEPGDRAPRDLLARYVDLYLSERHRDAPEHGCPVPILAGEAHRLPTPARERFERAVAAMQTRLAALIERTGVADPRARAVAAIAEMVGAVAVARIMPDRAESAALLASARTSVRAKLGLDAD